MMPACKVCDSTIHHGQYCSPDCREIDQGTDHVDESDWPDCPSCDGRTSGRGVTCRNCRRDAPDPVEVDTDQVLADHGLGGDQP